MIDEGFDVALFRLALVCFRLFTPVDYGLRLLGQAGDIPEVFSVCPTTAPAVIVWNVCVELDDWIVEICPQGSLVGVVASAWDPNDPRCSQRFYDSLYFG